MMKHTLRCHDFGEAPIMISRNGNGRDVLVAIVPAQFGQNRVSPQGVAATIAASFVARLANSVSIGKPRFALSTILTQNARAFHSVRHSK